MLPKKIQDEIVGRILSVVNPTRIILFGSYATGDADEDSDIDLLVVVKKAKSRRELALSIYKVLKGIGIAKDVLVADIDEYNRYRDVIGSIHYQANREGISIYEEVA